MKAAFSKIGAAIAISALIVCVSLPTLASAWAIDGAHPMTNNDSLWSLPATGETITPPASKDDATSTYIIASRMDCPSIRVSVFGSQSYDHLGSNYTVGGTVIMTRTMVGTGYRIRQNVYENLGKSWARLYIRHDIGNGVARGYWSPDSMYDYPSLNSMVS